MAEDVPHLLHLRSWVEASASYVAALHPDVSRAAECRFVQLLERAIVSDEYIPLDDCECIILFELKAYALVQKHFVKLDRRSFWIKIFLHGHGNRLQQGMLNVTLILPIPYSIGT